MARKAARRGIGQHHGDLRPALLSASIDILTDEGAEALSLREVARRAGVSVSAPYNHFADKNALLAAVAVDGFEKLAIALSAAVSERASAPPLERMAAAYVRFAIGHAAHYRVMFGPEMLAAEVAEPARVASRAAFERLCHAVAEANPDLEETAARREALLGWALAHGAVTLAVGGLLGDLDPKLDTEALSRTVGHACLRLATSGARRSGRR